MVEPTERLLDLFDSHDAKWTIIAEVAEILALRSYPEFSDILEKIENQLKRAVSSGHDVQLHLHPAWFNAKHNGRELVLDFSEYALVGLDAEKIDSCIRQGKDYLENLLRTVDENYRCIAYRSGDWLIQPSGKVIESLEKNDIHYDSYVF